ncbi:MAG: hypothetical protein ACM3ZQ_02590 [Bacillota bacterium]
MSLIRYIKIAGLVVVVVGGVLVVRRMLAKEERGQRREEAAPEHGNRQQAAQGGEQPPAQATQDERDLQEFQLVAARFEGLYTPLQMAVAGKVPEARRFQILREWDGRIRRAEQSNLTVAWLDLLVRYLGTIDPASLSSPDPAPVLDVLKTWYKRLIQWGLKRDERERFLISEESLADYSLDGDCQIGQTAVIELPSWTFQGQLVERGLAQMKRE